MANRGQVRIGIVETDMATLARGRQAVEDLEALLLRFGCRPVVTGEDGQRMAYDLQVVRVGLDVVEKYLAEWRALDFA